MKRLPGESLLADFHEPCGSLETVRWNYRAWRAKPLFFGSTQTRKDSYAIRKCQILAVLSNLSIIIGL
jgi:hypothetical protein